MAVIFALGAVPGLGAMIGVLLLCVGLGAWILALGHRRERGDDRTAAPVMPHDNTVTEG